MGSSDLVKTTGLSEVLEAEQQIAPAEAAKANELADDLGKSAPPMSRRWWKVPKSGEPNHGRPDPGRAHRRCPI
ncbi:MAG: hypothetical protein H0T83_05160 [Chthoniobacterales bacterium]|nr:hypothetical protein [Chthoniobacterales bacterium]